MSCALPRCPAMSPFDLVQTVDCFGQRVAVGVAFAADEALNARFVQAPAAADSDVLRTRTPVIRQAPVARGLTCVQRQLQGVAHDARMKLLTRSHCAKRTRR